MVQAVYVNPFYGQRFYHVQVLMLGEETADVFDDVRVFADETWLWIQGQGVDGMDWRDGYRLAVPDVGDTTKTERKEAD